MKEPVFPKIDKNYIREAQARAGRHKSIWSLVLFFLVVACLVLIFYVQFRFLWFIHTKFYPGHSGHLLDFAVDFMDNNISEWPACLMVMPILFSSLILGMMLGNFILWCITPVRNILDKEVEGVPFASFRVAMKQLGYIALFLTPISLALGIYGAWTLKTFQF